jgi:hypothetical protein
MAQLPWSPNLTPYGPTLTQVSYTPQKLECPPYWNGIKNYDVEAISIGMTCLVNLITVYKLVLKLLVGDTRGDRQHVDLIRFTLIL